MRYALALLSLLALSALAPAGEGGKQLTTRGAKLRLIKVGDQELLVQVLAKFKATDDVRLGKLPDGRITIQGAHDSGDPKLKTRRFKPATLQ